MKTLIDLAALFIGVVLAFIIQHAMPPMDGMHGAHILLVPLVFFYSAMVLPFRCNERAVGERRRPWQPAQTEPAWNCSKRWRSDSPVVVR